MPREEIPGYSEAIAQEKLLRDCAFLPINERVCGIDVLPMNMLHVLLLSIAESPFAYAKPNRPKILSAPRRLQRTWIQQFFWATSPHYRPGFSFRRIALANRVAKLDPAIAVDAICEYINEAFYDAGGGAPGKSYYSFVTGIIGALAPKYGSDEELLRKPLKRLFQYLNRERIAAGETLFNPSDEIRRQYRAKQNEDRAHND